MSDNIFKSAPPVTYREELKEVSWPAFENILSNRRSVRVYEKSPVPDEIVERCLRAALLAPNSSNLQPWEFYWIKSEDVKKQVADICLGQPAAATAPVLIACVARTKTWKRNRDLMLEQFSAAEAKGAKLPKSVWAYYQSLVPMFYSQGFLNLKGLAKRIVFFFRGIQQATPREPVNEHGMQMWAVKSTTLGCQNLMMAFSASGYDTCPMEGYDSKRLKKLLKLPSDAVTVMVISAGKRAPGGVYSPRTRFPEELFIKKV